MTNAIRSRLTVFATLVGLASCSLEGVAPTSVSAAPPDAVTEPPQVIADTVGGGACTQVSYHGGRVLDHVKIQNIFWGATYWNGAGASMRNQIDQAWRVIGNNRTFYGALAQYSTYFQATGPGQYLGAVTYNPDPATSIVKTDIQDMLRVALAFGLVPSNSDQNVLYIVYLPNGTSEIGNGYDGYHDRFTSSANNLVVNYGVIFSQPTLDLSTRTASHEVDEAVAAGGPASGGGWAWDEIGDPCQTLANRGFRFDGYLLERVWSRNDCGCVTTIAQPFASRHDLVWRDTRTGDVGVWQMNGSSSVRTYAGLATGIPNEWQIVGTGDFDGDGESDLLWRDSRTLQVGVWLLHGTTVANWNGVPNMAAVPNAQVAGVGDFDGDGLADVLWRDPNSGTVTIVFTGAQYTPLSPSFTAPIAWQIYGVADFDGDQKADLLWRNLATGEVGLWLMNGTTVKAYPVPGKNIGYRWTVAGVGDFDGDGKADILWRDFANDDVDMWLMNGGSVRSYANATHGITFDWAVQGVGDLDGDGKDDIIWRNTTTGDVSAWLLNGATIRTMDTPFRALPSEWQGAGMTADQT